MTDYTNKYSGRQSEQLAFAELTSELFTNGAVHDLFKLPGGAMIIETIVRPLTVYDGASPTLSLSLATAGTALQTTTALDALTVVAVTAAARAAVVAAATGDTIRVTKAAGTSTVGKVQIVVKYLVPGRAQFVQG